MKKLALALTAMGLSSTIFAALPGVTDSTVVNIPELDGGFVIGLMGDYLQPSPSHGDLDYASLNTGTGTDPADANNFSSPFASSIKSVDPEYSWGWGANIGYIFPQTANDINISYSHLNASNTNNVATSFPANFSLITPIVQGFVLTPLADFVSAKAEYSLNQVDLTLGQLINVGCRLRLHPNVGLRWTSIDRDLYLANAGGISLPHILAPKPQLLASSNWYSESSHDASDFDGIGPLAGLDASYYIGMGFGAVVHADSALLMGSIQNKLTAIYSETTTYISFADPALQTFLWNSNSDNRLVPVFDEKLGLDYTYLFNNAANSDLTLEVGWQASQYFDAIDKVNANGFFFEPFLNSEGVVPLNGGSQILGRDTSRVGLSGPYATLTLHI
jgi:hypothetical protein